MFSRIAKWIGYVMFACLCAMVGGSMGIVIIGSNTELAAITSFIMGFALMIMMFEEAYVLKAVSAVTFMICFVGFVLSVMARIFI